MARPIESLPKDLDERCEGCAYQLGGLPMKGRCPECGMPYVFEFLYRRPHLRSERCESCNYRLRGLPLKGKCPECGESYAYDRPRRVRPKPGVRDNLHNWLAGWRMPTTATMIAVFVIAMVAVAGVIIWIALNQLHIFDEQPHGIL